MKNTVLVFIAGTLWAITHPQACDIAPQGTCYAIELDQYMPADQFFKTVAAQANRAGICTVGRVKGKTGNRMYIMGQRIEKDKGCLSPAEIKDLKNYYQLKYDCAVYTCDEL